MTSSLPYYSINSPQHRSWWARSWPLALLVVLGATGVTVTWLKPEAHFLEYAVCSANRTIYTVDSDLPNVQCIVVHDTLIADTVIIIRPDSIIVPGLTDAHAHMLHYGFKMNLNLEDCTSVNEVLSHLKAYLLTTFRDDFDREPLLRGRRTFLARIDVHASSVSNRVLQFIAPLPENVDGGLIIRDEHGKPTGISIDNAMDLIPSQPFIEARAMEHFTRATTDALAVGLTKCFPSKRMVGFVRINVLYLYSSSYIGALGSFGAALLEPPEALAKLVRELSIDGWQVNIHCIGDRANHGVLDIYEDMLANASFSLDIDALRPRIEHAQILTLDDIKRTGKLGGKKSSVSYLVFAFVQPTHATNDMWYAEDWLVCSPLFISSWSKANWIPIRTRAEALKGVTLDTAYASFSEDILGSLSIEKKADFVVLDHDIMTVPMEEILGAKVTATVIDGGVEYGNL
ncbi:hypothetical protein EDB19DRAFT_1738028 [Suillus lakei]|nr:hypothetical protein EDB19DRAFT_1738028 [Suillus lakei]